MNKWLIFIGNTMYSHMNILGNEGGNDGYNFRGRGLIQITGKYNYT